MEELSQYIQDGSIRLMIEDKEFLKRCRNLVKPQIYDGMVRATICKQIYKFYDNYQDAPNASFFDFFFDESKRRSFNKKDEPLFEMYFDEIYKEDWNKKYVVDGISRLVQFQTLTKAVLRSAELINQEKYSDIKKIMIDALNTQVGLTDLGVNLWEWDCNEEDEENDFICRTGVSHLDEKIGGYKRSELFLYLAATNVGKSWALINGVKSVLLEGKNCIYYTMEMTERKILNRLASVMSGMRSKHRNFNKSVTVTYIDGEEQVLGGDEFDGGRFKKISKSYERKGGNCFIKGGIEGRTTVDDISAHIDDLEARKGIVPDIIFVDYADLLKGSKKFDRDDLEATDNYINLRALAKERNIAVVSAAQGNRESIDVRRVGLKKMARSIGGARVADVVMTLNQTEDEVNSGLMRMFAAKVREAEKYFEITVRQCFTVGGFCLESWDTKDDKNLTKENGGKK